MLFLLDPAQILTCPAMCHTNQGLHFLFLPRVFLEGKKSSFAVYGGGRRTSSTICVLCLELQAKKWQADFDRFSLLLIFLMPVFV